MKLFIRHKNLTFSDALEWLKLGKWIKCPEWEGYWFMKGGNIWVMTHEGKVVDTPWFEQTVLREDWQVVEEFNASPFLKIVQDMNLALLTERGDQISA